jgi:ABC-type sulfate transport system permease subunit
MESTKRKFTIGKRLLMQFSQIAIAVAPVVATKIVSVWLWGETEIPNCLKTED